MHAQIPALLWFFPSIPHCWTRCAKIHVIDRSFSWIFEVVSLRHFPWGNFHSAKSLKPQWLYRWAVDNSRFERAGRMDCESISFASNNLEIDARTFKTKILEEWNLMQISRWILALLPFKNALFWVGNECCEASGIDLKFFNGHNWHNPPRHISCSTWIEKLSLTCLTCFCRDFFLAPWCYIRSR